MKRSRRISNESSYSESDNSDDDQNPKKIKFEDWMGSDEDSGNDLKKSKEKKIGDAFTKK